MFQLSSCLLIQSIFLNIYCVEPFTPKWTTSHISNVRNKHYSSVSDDVEVLDGRTPKLSFKPKQSLGQNYLSDQNYVLKICNALGEGKTSARDEAKEIAAFNEGARVIELGPGALLFHVSYIF